MRLRATLALLVSLALVACGGSGDEATDTTPDAAPEALVEVTPDLPGDPGTPEPEPEVTPDTAEPTPEVVAEVKQEAEADDLPPLPVCQGTWDRPAWDASASTVFQRGPFLQDVQADRATVVFRLRPPDAMGQLPAEGCVVARLEGVAEPWTACAPLDERGQAEVRLTGLPPDTTGTYVARAGENEVGPLTFRSAPLDSAPLRLLVFADAHANGTTIPQVAALGSAAGVDAAVAVGDSVSQPEEAQFDGLIDALHGLIQHVAWWPVLGNHEARGQAYFDAIALPGANPKQPHEAWYSARVGTVWFAALELMDIMMAAGFGVDTPEVAWLKEQLATDAARTATWRLFFVHEPPWCAGWGHCDDPVYQGEYTLRTFLVPLAAQHDVAAIFSGHMHGYEHGVVDGVHLVITGGAGGALDQPCPTPDDFPAPWTAAYEHHALIVDAACDALTIEAKRLDGSTLDTVVIPKP